MRSKQYEPDVLAGHGRRPAAAEPPVITAEPGLVVEDAAGQFCGAVTGWEADAVILEDRRGRQRAFPFRHATFLFEGKPVRLARPRQPASGPGVAVRPPGATAPGAGTGRTASGSVAVPPGRAKVARASRIYVEGRHDAELVEKVWGDDLREAGIVVEYLGGIDNLPQVVAEFAPAPTRRLGVLVDHMVPGSKESAIAADALAEHVLIVGHPYIDVWQAVRPSVLGIGGWPAIPPGRPWKDGVLAAIGWPPDTGAAWQRILRSVQSFADLEPAFLGRVEELIDFVTVPGAA